MMKYLKSRYEENNIAELLLCINNVKDATRPFNTKDLFAPYEQYNKKDCTELVGTYHGWGYCLSRCSKEDKTVPIMKLERSMLLKTSIN